MQRSKQYNFQFKPFWLSDKRKIQALTEDMWQVPTVLLKTEAER